jgi:amino acid adenylation domain-containing protein
VSTQAETPAGTDKRARLAHLLAKKAAQAPLATWNETAADYPRTATLHALVAAQAAATPDRTAVVFAGRSLTYAELNRRANQVAHHLRGLGVGPDVPVALRMDRSEAMLVGLLGILKAGGAYVPLDPTYPAERLAYMLADSEAHLLLTSGDAPEAASCAVVDFEREAAAIAGQPDTNPADGAGPNNLAYIIYTSGSTGRPKGVAVQHGSVVNFLASMRSQPGLSMDDALLAVTSISFDIHVLELYLPLTTGAKVVLASRADAMGGQRLRDLMAAHGVTIMQATPATWRLLLESGWQAPVGLKLLTGGEALGRELADRLLAGGAELWNMYGPTETTVWSMVWKVTADDSPVLIGRPIANTQVHVLDASLAPVPVGEAGELYIGGDGLARGYLKRPALTAERFVTTAFGRVYRTGDLARWRADGQLEFLGRADFQVKVRGFRIEPGEIETVLERHPLIAQAVVSAVEQGGEAELVAHFVPRGQAPTVAELRSHLQEQLPDYMVPTRYMALAAFPLTPNGKVDRKALPQPALAAEVRPVAVPDGELERTIIAIWQQVLRVDHVGLHDNFFDLGGHSIKLVQVHSRLKQAVDCPLDLTDLFDCPTVASLAARLRAPQGAAMAPAAAGAQTGAAATSGRTDIAIVGMAGRFPGANEVEAFWQMLADGVEGVTRFTRDELVACGEDPTVVDHPDYVPVKGLLAGADRFDAAFFGFSPREAQTLDPQQRVFLETAWETVEHAGYDPGRYPGRIGLWAGTGLPTYMALNLMPNRAFTESVGIYQVFINNDKDFLATRTAYKLNLTGPALTVQTACSTSLVAVHEACKSLRTGETDMALAGGVSVTSPLEEGYRYQDGTIMSRDGACRAFDEKASGTIVGNGVGLVLLKRLEDARRDGDTIYAVIRGSAVNNDGSLKVGYTAPSIDGQARVIRAALKQADVPAESVTYVEAHGTGTVLGDPIEVAGLTRAFRDEGATGTGYCALGSVKTNIGHLDTAAGVAGLIKTVQALRYKQLPPSLHYESPNPKIDFGATPFVVNTALRAWETGGQPRRAGVSSFGIGGTNAHAVLEEAPPALPTSPSRPAQLLVLSARTPSALEQATARMAAHLEANPALDLADVAYTLHMGRKPMTFRRAVVATDAAGAAQALKARGWQGGQEQGPAPVAFLFPGQGAQHPGMLAGLYRHEPVFRDAFDRCAAVLELDLHALVFDGTAEQLGHTAVTQPALFAVEYALAQLWLSWGVRPRAMMGHSLGEYVAAVLAGVMRLEDALKLVAARGRLIGSLPGGAMMAVPLPEAEVLPLLGEALSVAAVNGPASTVISGPTDAVDALAAQLGARTIEGRRLHTSHAFHSAMLDPIVAEFEALVAQVLLGPPVIPFVSNVTGTWITDEAATSPAYWAQQMRRGVRFADGLATLFADADTALLEVGPGQTLSALARQHPARGEERAIVASCRHPREQSDDPSVLLGALGQLWLAGVPVDWAGFWAGERRRRVALPTYPFERQRYWVEAPRYGAAGDVADAPAVPAAMPDAVANEADQADFVTPDGELEQAVADVWQEVLGIARVGAHDSFFALGGDSLVASRVISRLRELFPVEVPLSAIFEAPTVAALAARVEALLLEKLASLEDAETEVLANN